MIAFAGCSGLPDPPCDLEAVPGVCLGLDPEHTPMVEPGSATPYPLNIERWQYALEQSASWWGVSLEDLRGVRIGLTTSHGVCEHADGCAEERGRNIWLWTEDGDPCPEWPLPHEIGHILVGDGDHRDPRFVHDFCAIVAVEHCTPRIACP